MSKLSLKAQERKIFGRKVRALRRSGMIPGNIFGPKTDSKAVSVDKKSFLELFEKSGETTLVDLVVEGEKSPRPTLITNLAVDPVTSEVLHIDFHQVDLTVKTAANIPVELVGKAPASDKGGIVVTLLNEVEVEALPADLPESFDVDISSLSEIGDTIHAKDLKFDRSKVTIKIADEEPIVTVQEPEKEEEPVAPAETTEGTPEAGSAEEPKTEEKTDSSAQKPTSEEKPAS